MARDLGATDIVRYNNIANLNSGGAWSWSLRFNPDALGSPNKFIFNGLNDDNSANAWRVYSGNRDVIWEIYSSSSNMWIADNSLTAAEHHMCGTWTGNIGTATTELKLYIDGTSIADASSNGSGTATSSGGLNTIGGQANDTSHCPGIYAEVAVWQRTLSADEAAALSQGYVPLYFPQSLIFYVPFIRSSQDIVGGATISSNDEGTTVAHFTQYIPRPEPYIITAPVAAAAANPKGPLGMPLHGPLAGPIG